MATPNASYILDGNSDYITLVDAAVLDPATSLSIGMWVKLDYDALDSGDIYLYDLSLIHI